MSNNDNQTTYNHKLLSDGNLDFALGGPWPGVQLYYPPIKYNPSVNSYESLEEATARMRKHAYKTSANTLLFDLEDGCMKKAESRELLRRELPNFTQRNFQIAVRINPFRTEEYLKDMQLVKQCADFIDVVILAKAGENYGAAEIRDMSAELVAYSSRISIQPIIEHPRSLKIASELLQFQTVRHVVFGIHDFSKAMAIHIDPENWVNQLIPYLSELLIEARVAGKGVIGGVEVLMIKSPMPEHCVEQRDIRRWLDLHGEYGSRVVYKNAVHESSMGLTGKQTITPNHIQLCKVAFTPSPKIIEENIAILEQAIATGALTGGAISYKGQMMDPPMFGKALQVLLRANALHAIDQKGKDFILKVLNNLPVHTIRESWPYGNF